MKNIYQFFTAAILIVSISSAKAQCSVPNPVTASPTAVCAGNTLNLNATSSGNSINWYTSPTGGISSGTSASAANYIIAPVVTTTYFAESFSGSAGGTLTLNYTGSVQQVVIPLGVTQITIDARGAQGGGTGGGGGLGARMIGTYSVIPGQVLKVVVPSMGNLQVGGNVQNSSGGGGGAFVYLSGGTPTLLVAAGGGGGRCNYTGSVALPAGTNGTVSANGNASADGAGLGGVSGGAGAAGFWSGNPCSGGGAGWFLNGGGPYGGFGYSSWAGGQGFCGGGGGGCGGVGGFGGGGGGGNHYGGGGGGGGYSGGGGGTDPTHGGGGGSFSAGTNQNNTSGFQTGNGQVIIVGVSGVGCVSAVRTAVTASIVAAPSITITSATNTICQGASVTLTANITGATSFSWNTGAVTATNIETPSVTSSYTITAANLVTGCTSSAVETISVTPNTIQTSGSGTICSGQNINLAANGGLTYTWQPGNLSGFQILVAPIASTNYTVNSTTANGCVFAATANVQVATCTGLSYNSKSKDDTIKFFPNPNNGEFTLEMSDKSQKTIEITDLTGRVIISKITTEEKSNFNMSNLSNGIYYIRIQSDDNLSVLKMIKQ